MIFNKEILKFNFTLKKTLYTSQAGDKQCGEEDKSMNIK